MFAFPQMIVIPTRACASQREAHAEWRACPERAQRVEGDLLFGPTSFEEAPRSCRRCEVA